MVYVEKITFELTYSYFFIWDQYCLLAVKVPHR